MNPNLHRASQQTFTACGIVLLLIFGSRMVSAQPTIVSTVPANMATGVSPSAAVVFTFSEPMDTANTSVQFFTFSFTMLTTTAAWSANNTVLTCTPTPPFPAGTNIIWSVTGQNPSGMSLSGNTGGFFTTASGSGGGGGSGTNAITTFVVGKSYLYQQLTAGPPTLETNESYFFTASTTLASNRTANTITLTLPSGAVSNLMQDFVAPEHYSLFAYDTNNTRFESTFGQGNYLFKVTATSSNQQVTVNLPTTMPQPPAPHIANYTAAQSITATQAFTLTWDAFQGGTTSDFIGVTIGDKVFATQGPGGTNVLDGTKTSVTIPAHILAANSNYMADVVFYHFLGTSNSTYNAGGYRATATSFTINTTGAPSTVPVVSHPVWGSSGFSFDVATSAGQALKVRYSTDLSLPIAQWLTLLTTNSPGTSIHLTIPSQSVTARFFRIQNGP